MRIALGLEYDGSSFVGWQAQQHATGVQSVVERALSVVAAHPVEVVAAGRTDAGVHAAMQVVHFDTPAERNDRAWLLGTTSNLPPSVSVLWVRRVPETFHARFSAQARRYRYIILNRPCRPAIGANQVAWVRQPLDVALMHQAAQQLAGEHDFSSFRAAQCQARTPRRHLHEISVTRQGQWVVLDVCANAFLHHMVRNIAGVLITVGKREQEPGWVQQVLAARDRTQGGVTAVAGGLYLTGVTYAPSLGLPSQAQLVACPLQPDQV